MATKKQSKNFPLKQSISLSSSKGKLILFLLIFALIGGGLMAYRSFAASGNIATFGGQDLKPSSKGDATLVNETKGSKKNVPVWEMKGGTANKWLGMKKPVTQPASAKQARSCAKVKLVSGTGDFALTHPNGQGHTEWFKIQATTDYQEICTKFLALNTPRQDRYADVGWGFGNKDTLRVGYISIHWK